MFSRICWSSCSSNDSQPSKPTILPMSSLPMCSLGSDSAQEEPRVQRSPPLAIPQCRPKRDDDTEQNSLTGYYAHRENIMLSRMMDCGFHTRSPTDSSDLRVWVSARSPSYSSRSNSPMLSPNIFDMETNDKCHSRYRASSLDTAMRWQHIYVWIMIILPETPKHSWLYWRGMVSMIYSN